VFHPVAGKPIGRKQPLHIAVVTLFAATAAADDACAQFAPIFHLTPAPPE
jgi:hypothetical protein